MQQVTQLRTSLWDLRTGLCCGSFVFSENFSYGLRRKLDLVVNVLAETAVEIKQKAIIPQFPRKNAVIRQKWETWGMSKIEWCPGPESNQ
jgi:hypothetical protein